MSQEIQQVAQQIIVACSQFFDPSISPEQRQSINDALVNFQNQPDSWRVACEIMKSANNNYILFITQNTFEVFLKSYWKTISVEEQIMFRNFMIQYYFTNYSTLSRPVAIKIAKIIVWIAEYEWPTTFPDFLTIISNGFQKMDQLECSLLLLSVTVEEFYSDDPNQPFLTMRKKEIQKLFNSEIQFIIKALNHVIVQISNQISGNQSIEDDRWMLCLNIIYIIIQNNKIEETLTIELINILCLSIFKYQSSEAITAIMCINEILSKKLIPLNLRVFIGKLIESIYQLLQILIQMDLNEVSSSYLLSFNRLIYMLMTNGLFILIKNKEFDLIDFFTLFKTYTFHQISLLHFLLCLQSWAQIAETFFISGHISPKNKERYISLFVTLRTELLQLSLQTPSNTSNSPSLLFDLHDDTELDDIVNNNELSTILNEEERKETYSPITGDLIDNNFNFKITPTSSYLYYKHIISLLDLLSNVEASYESFVESVLSMLLERLKSLYQQFVSNPSIRYTDPAILSLVESITFLLNYSSTIVHLFPHTPLPLQLYTAVTQLLQHYMNNNLQMYNNEYKYLLSGCLAFYYSLLRWILCGGSEQIQDQQSIITSLISISKVILFNDLSPFPSYLCKQALKLLCGIPERLRQPQLWTLSENKCFYTNFLSSCSNLPLDYQHHLLVYVLKSLVYPPTMTQDRMEILSSVLNPILTPILNTSTNLDQLNFNSYARVVYLLTSVIPVVKLESKSFRLAYFQLVVPLYPHLLQVLFNLTRLFYDAPNRRYTYSSITRLFNGLLYLVDWIFNCPNDLLQLVPIATYHESIQSFVSILPSLLPLSSLPLRDEVFIVKLLRASSLYMKSSSISMSTLLTMMSMISSLSSLIMNKGNLVILNEYITTTGSTIDSFVSHPDHKEVLDHNQETINPLISSLLQALLQPFSFTQIAPETYKSILNVLNMLWKTSLFHFDCFNEFKQSITTVLLSVLFQDQFNTLQDDILYSLYTFVSEDTHPFFENLLPSFINSIQELSVDSKSVLLSTVQPVNDMPSFNQQLTALIRNVHVLRKN